MLKLSKITLPRTSIRLNVIIDNILMSVEQTSYNVYQELQDHLDKPDRMETYCREIVENNPYVTVATSSTTATTTTVAASSLRCQNSPILFCLRTTSIT